MRQFLIGGNRVRFLVLGVAFFCLALTLTWAMSLNSSSGHGPRQEARRAGGLICEKAIWDFSVVDVSDSKTGTKILSHEFILTNDSQKVVEIQDVKATCGCMIAGGYKEVLSPGENTRVKLSVTLPMAPGPFHKKLVVILEGESPSLLELEVVGAIASNPNLYCIPTQINFGKIRPGQTKERSLQVFRYDQTPLKSFRVSSSDEVLQCFVELNGSHVSANPTARICLVAKDLPAGQYATTLVVSTELAKTPDLVVPVVAQVTEKSEDSIKNDP